MKTLSRELSCCVCDTRKHSQFYKKIDEFQLLKCKSCNVVYIDQVSIDPQAFLDDANTSAINGQIEYWGYPEYFIKYSSIFDYFFKERFERISSYSPPDGEWLDIGSGFGLWQTFLNSKKIVNAGIEIENKACGYSQSIGLNIEQVSIEKFQTDKKFAVITICDVLEHVEDPAGILKKCRELLMDNGLLYIQVPNVLGLKIPYGDQLGLPHHLWQFSPEPLAKVGKKSGLEMLNYWTGIQGVIRYYENGGPGFYNKLIWGIGKKLKIGNRLQMIFRK